MKRRAILFASGALLAAAATRAFAQANTIRRIVMVHPGSQSGYQSLYDAFRGALKSLGYVEGRDISVESRWADGRLERLPAMAAEAVKLNPAAIVTAGSAATAASKQATSSIPIVFASAFNPVEQGFVASLRRPGGNVTGILLFSDIAAKIVEVTREAFPGARRLAILLHEADVAHKIALEHFLAATRQLKFDPVVVRVANLADLDRAFQELAAGKADALYLPDLTFSTENRKPIIERALSARLPLLSGFYETTVDGALLSYGTRREENYQRAAALVDKILKGVKPGDLPVEQPVRFQLTVNMKTAKAIGITLSPVTMLRADKVIE